MSGTSAVPPPPLETTYAARLPEWLAGWLSHSTSSVPVQSSPVQAQPRAGVDGDVRQQPASLLGLGSAVVVPVCQPKLPAD